MFRGANDKRRIHQSTPSSWTRSAPRSDGHGPGVCVNSKDEGPRLAGSAAQHGLAIPGAEVDHDPVRG